MGETFGRWNFARLERKILQNFEGALQDGIGDDLAIRPKVKTRSVLINERYRDRA